MSALKVAFASFAVAFATISSTFAQTNTTILDDLDADRLNANQVKIEFEYDGSACEQVEPAQLGEIVDGTLEVTFPTTATAEMCTMQVVEIEVEQAIQADETVQNVTVILLAPDGTVMATETTAVDND